jgi:hypothetical protein
MIITILGTIWLIKFGRRGSENKTMGIRKYNLQTSQVRMMEKIRLKAGVSYFLSLHCQNNRVENTSTFICSSPTL